MDGKAIKVGIVGCGVCGSALRNWLLANNPNAEVRVSDPPKGMEDDLSGVDVAFVQVHLPTEADGSQDLSLIESIVRGLPDVPVFVRTTILPGTSYRLSRSTGHRVFYMPEFLTDRTNNEDFCRQTMVFTGETELLSKVFPGRKFVVMSPLEAELTKYIHNVFGAYKVTFFNAAKEYVEKIGGDWAKVHTGVLLSGYINEMHTIVPGPDGKYGYGGKCFPKDVMAFASATKGTSLGTLIEPLQSINEIFRREGLKFPAPFTTDRKI